ncbi:Pycsar system effector family protein [Streptomyces antimycoticus]|uniref:Pycsar system effector family protein n=1 Tax=Streptomyces antimycoticus TaxID=68175 RepID=UPI0037D63B72
MSTASAQGTVAQAHVDKAIADMEGRLARIDSKASLLLALTGAVLAATLSVAASADLPLSAAMTGTLTVAAFLAATVILLLAVRPRFGPGWPTWPQLTTSELAERLAARQQMEEVRVLATITRRKFAYLRVAIDCALTGLALLALTAGLAVAS